MIALENYEMKQRLSCLYTVTEQGIHTRPPSDMVFYRNKSQPPATVTRCHSLALTDGATEDVQAAQQQHTASDPSCEPCGLHDQTRHNVNISLLVGMRVLHGQGLRGVKFDSLATEARPSAVVIGTEYM